jgi:hypothetical protein
MSDSYNNSPSDEEKHGDPNPNSSNGDGESKGDDNENEDGYNGDSDDDFYDDAMIERQDRANRQEALEETGEYIRPPI